MPINARVVTHAGRNELHLDGVAVPPLLYGLTDAPGGRWTWEEVPARQIRLFAEHGLRLFQIDLWLLHLVDADGVLDIALARRQVAGVLAQCADAQVMIRLHLNPPADWLRTHPEACVAYADTVSEDTSLRWGMLRPLSGDEARPLRASFASRDWRAWADAQVRAFCRLLAAAPEGDAVMGIQIANGVYGEWHQFGFLMHDPDVGPAATAAFRAWLAAAYHDDAGLAQAWGEPSARIALATLPDSAEREAADQGILRDPQHRQRTIDAFRWQHACLAEAVELGARAVKASWPRPIITAAFFGYFHSMFGRQAAGGHLALETLLRSPWLDALCAPTSYTDGARRLGGPGHPRGLPDAVRRAGKLWLDEMDQPTHVGSPWDRAFASTVDEDIAIQRRNILHPVTRGGGAWWYDFGPIAGCDWYSNGGTRGWWDHPRLLADAAAILRVANEAQQRPFTRAADVLVVHDPWSFAHTVSQRLTPEACAKLLTAPTWGGDPLSHLAIDDLSEALHRSGVIHGDALLGELAELDLTPYRVVILATTPVLDAAQRRLIDERVRAAGRELWCLGFAGWSDGHRIGPDLACALTGLECILGPTAVATLTTGGDQAWSRSLSAPLAVPACTDPRAEVLATWQDGGTAAARHRDVRGVRAWWGVPPADPGLLRRHLRAAGCRVVNEHDDATLLGAGLLLVHSLSGGPRTLRPPGGPVIETILAPRSTTVFDLASGRILLGT
jgi:hypothetical protein